MKTTGTVSTAIIDRRKHVAAGAIGGVVAALLAVFGVRSFTTGSAADPDRDLVYLVSAAIDRGQAYWDARIAGYRPAHVVLFEQSTATACGVGLTSSGPFWCSGDDRIYIDLAFLRSIRGDLARAIVLAHELGHHVQGERRELGATSVHVELQADCYAGAWVADEDARGNLGSGDVQLALDEIAAVGDDRLCPGCSPEDWQHGSSAQRVAAVQRGMSGGDCSLVP